MNKNQKQFFWLAKICVYTTSYLLLYALIILHNSRNAKNISFIDIETNGFVRVNLVTTINALLPISSSFVLRIKSNKMPENKQKL